MFLNFLGCTFAFAVALYGSLFLGYAGPVIFGGGAALALLLLLLLKQGEIEEKLDELLKKRDEHDKQ